MPAPWVPSIAPGSPFPLSFKQALDNAALPFRFQAVIRMLETFLLRQIFTPNTRSAKIFLIKIQVRANNAVKRKVQGMYPPPARNHGRAPIEETYDDDDQQERTVRTLARGIRSECDRSFCQPDPPFH